MLDTELKATANDKLDEYDLWGQMKVRVIILMLNYLILIWEN
jgi:hypothetical protein